MNTASESSILSRWDPAKRPKASRRLSLLSSSIALAGQPSTTALFFLSFFLSLLLLLLSSWLSTLGSRFCGYIHLVPSHVTSSHLGLLSHLVLTHPVAVPVPASELSRPPCGSFLLFSLVGFLDRQVVSAVTFQFVSAGSGSRLTRCCLWKNHPPLGCLILPFPLHPCPVELPTAIFPGRERT